MASKKKEDFHYQKNNMKRKVFAKGKQKTFKRFKRTPKYVKDNLENQVAREKEKDPYLFTDSDSDMGDDLGMGLELSDLPLLDDDIENKTKDIIALTQDSVSPFFADEASYDETKLTDGLTELRHSSFRPNQKEAIKRILFGRSTLFISPTGSGKSLCYQLPALLYWRYRKYMTIVVSPLISLMEDQIHSLPKCLRAVSIHSNHNIVQKRRSIEQLVNGEAQIVFISPEAIVGGLLDVDDLKNLPPVGFVCIDEAHCLSEWSHNFRPAYLQFLRILNEKMNIKTFLGLTATATKSISFAIARSLTINPDNDVIGSTTIPENLILSVSYERNKKKALIELLQSPTFRIMPSIIIYCNRREETEQVATNIRTAMQAYSSTMEVPERSKTKMASSDIDSAKGSSDSESPKRSKEIVRLPWHAEAYHAGLGSEARKQIQRKFVKGEIRVVVATVAFGMGINKSNIRAVVHYDMPGSFESYVQEIGRAGRDGQVAQCHMFLSADKSDLYYQQRNIYSSVVEKKNLTKLVRYLFKPCKVHIMAADNAADQEKLDKLNQADPHYISNERKTDFIATEVCQGSDDDELDCVLDSENMTQPKKSPTKFVRKSIVKKHRPCKGHEIAFPVEEATNEINLWPESIITIMCQIQQAYPQLLMKQFPTIRSNCTLFCYKGTEQMNELAKKCQPVERALFLHRREQMKKFGSSGDTPQKLKFDVVQVASLTGKDSADVIRMLKKTEWEIVEETGRFRRSQIRVNFDGNSFHALAAGDLTEEELKEVEKFVIDSNNQYEIKERERIAKVYNTFRKHSITVEQMKEKSIRLGVSDRLKVALNTYFEPTLRTTQMQSQNDFAGTLVEETNDLNDDTGRISNTLEATIRTSAKAFISAHGKGDFKPTTIARIFQGISTPNYPAEVWGPNRRWWRKHVDVDFRVLTQLIHQHLV